MPGHAAHCAVCSACPASPSGHDPCCFWYYLQVLRLLGTGGEGETWLCVDQRNKQEVAIKLVRRPIPRSITQIIQVQAAAGVMWFESAAVLFGKCRCWHSTQHTAGSLWGMH